jgi:hypothetical protein
VALTGTPVGRLERSLANVTAINETKGSQSLCQSVLVMRTFGERRAY